MTEEVVEQRRNGYHDEDFHQAIEEIEGYDDEIASIKAEAAGKVSQVKKKIENAKKVAKANGIPKSTLNGVLKTRKLERQLAEVADSISEDEVELYADSVGQFSFLKPNDGETAAQAAARHAAQKAKEHHDAEQAEGEKVLNEITGQAAE